MTNSNIQNIEKACDSSTPRAVKSKPAKASKTAKLMKQLKSKRGATIEQLRETSGWQAHSVRGFLSATVKKKLGLTLVNEIGKDGHRRYRIENSSAGK